MSVRAMLNEVGSAELVYWSAFFVSEDERRMKEMETFGMAGM
jgi:hypothetical protein